MGDGTVVGALALAFVPLGVVLIVGGVYWIARLFVDEEDEATTADDRRLINVGCGEYDSESLVAFRGIGAILLGIFSILVGVFA